MSDYERLLWVFAENLERGIANVFKQSTDPAEWVDGYEEAIALMRRMRGMFVASLVGELEESLGRPFRSVFDQLSDQPTTKNSRYWFVDMPSTSSLRGRAKVMWAIRVAYTHGNGHTDRISDVEVKNSILPTFSRCHFRGVRVEQDYIHLSKDVTFPALKTAVEIFERFAGKHSLVRNGVES